MAILTINCGSSSVKYRLFGRAGLRVLAMGRVERIGEPGCFFEHHAIGAPVLTVPAPLDNHESALALALETLLDHGTGSLPADDAVFEAVGHRVVHGGERYDRSVLIGIEEQAVFRELAELAPLHNPVNLAGINAARALLPEVPHCAVFDTAWHQTMPPRAYRYALPETWYRDYGVRRYGFHGTSFLYVARRAAVLLGRDPFDVDLVLFHVGNGASANAVRRGLSHDTSMGLTPLEGLVMGTRAGDHDPAVAFHMMRTAGLTRLQVEAALLRDSGLAGLTGGVSDRREIEHLAGDGDRNAQLALDLEAYRLRKYLGAYLAALGRVDAVVFTGGAGERSAPLRRRCLQGLDGLGIGLDDDRNEAADGTAEAPITTDASPIPVWVIPTDEERVMAEDTRALLERSYDVHTRFNYTFQEPDYRPFLPDPPPRKDIGPTRL